MAEPDNLDVGDSRVRIDPAQVAERTSTFEDVYAEHFRPMVRLAALMCGSADVARDVVQDAFVNLHLKWSAVDNPEAYVRRSVVNGCRSRARWERRRRGRPSKDVAVTEQQPDELFDVLAELPHRQRAAIVLKYYEQRTESEIASILGCRPGTVGPLVSRGLARLRRDLDANGGTS